MYRLTAVISMATVVALSALFTTAAPATADVDSAPVVTTVNGDVEGHNADGTTSWLGIPYAAPPVGGLRWQPPAPARSWEGVRQATTLSSPCLQATTAYDDHRGSEDCLYLNVFAPSKTPSGTRSGLPVMVWLHGGGFINGSGNDFEAGQLANTAGAVVVTVNYRLGPFGWLALDSLSKEQGGSSGDYGLMDQVAALKWVRANIAGFGGNRSLITLFGQSAGGESALAQLASPRARGLFERAIVHSAPVGLNLPTVAAASARNQKAFATEVGCADVATQLGCLRNVPAERALAAGHESWNLIKDLGLYWTPTVGGPSLPDQWLNSFRQGNYNRVPIMFGNTRNEGRLFTAIYENANGHAMTDTEKRDKFKQFFSAAAPILQSVYTPPAYATPGDAMSAAITDGLFACGGNRDRDALQRHQSQLYSFEFTDPNAFEVEVHGQYSAIRDGHDADLPFLFQFNHGRLGRDKPPFSPGQQTIASQMGQYWGNFARTGNPNGLGLPTWPTYVAGISTPTQDLTPGGARTLAFAQNFTEHKCALWEPLLQAQQALAGR